MISLPAARRSCADWPRDGSSRRLIRQFALVADRRLGRPLIDTPDKAPLSARRNQLHAGRIVLLKPADDFRGIIALDVESKLTSCRMPAVGIAAARHGLQDNRQQPIAGKEISDAQLCRFTGLMKEGRNSIEGVGCADGGHGFCISSVSAIESRASTPSP